MSTPPPPPSKGPILVALIALSVLVVACVAGGILLTNAHRDATPLELLGAVTLAPLVVNLSNSLTVARTEAKIDSVHSLVNGQLTQRIEEAVANALAARRASDPAPSPTNEGS